MPILKDLQYESLLRNFLNIYTHFKIFINTTLMGDYM